MGIEKVKKKAFDCGRAFRAGMDYALKRRGFALDDWVTLKDKEGEYYHVDLPGENPNKKASKPKSDKKAETAKNEIKDISSKVQEWRKLREGQKKELDNLRKKFGNMVRVDSEKDNEDRRIRTKWQIEKGLNRLEKEILETSKENFKTAIQQVEKKFSPEAWMEQHPGEDKQFRSMLSKINDIETLEYNIKEGNKRIRKGNEILKKRKEGLENEAWHQIMGSTRTLFLDKPSKIYEAAETAMKQDLETMGAIKAKVSAIKDRIAELKKQPKQ